MLLGLKIIGRRSLKKFLKKIKCKISGHKLSVKDISNTGNVEKTYCSRCERFYGMNHDVKAFLKWDNELEQMFVLINDRHSKCWAKERQWLKK